MTEPIFVCVINIVVWLFVVLAHSVFNINIKILLIMSITPREEMGPMRVYHVISKLIGLIIIAGKSSLKLVKK